MTIITTKIAGVERVAACTPNVQGDVPDAAIAAKAIAGTDEIYLGGGVQTGALITIGTNHVLPTRGAARYTAGLWGDNYQRTVAYQEVRNLESSTLLGELYDRTSRVERFESHARSGEVRVAKYRGSVLSWSEYQSKF